MTSRYHGNKLFGSQQKGAYTTTKVKATRTANKQYVYINETTTLHVHHAFLHVFSPSLHDCDMKLPNFMSR